jgi:2,4-dienoyl-CoA reductase-like NADH-dependent reductase (Old Yellow Enzyme family)
VRRTRTAVGDDFIICYRMSMADYVEDGQSWDEIIALATEVEAAGATIINTGIGWHEARVPTPSGLSGKAPSWRPSSSAFPTIGVLLLNST